MTNPQREAEKAVVGVAHFGRGELLKQECAHDAD